MGTSFGNKVMADVIKLPWDCAGLGWVPNLTNVPLKRESLHTDTHREMPREVISKD